MSYEKDFDWSSDFIGDRGCRSTYVMQIEETVLPNAIGGFLPMTGAVAAYGQDAKAGIEIAMEMKPRSWVRRWNL